MLRVAIVDDHPIALHGLASIVEPVSDLTVVAAVPAWALLPRDRDGRVAADVVVLDLYLGDGKPALSAVTALSATVPVLVMSASRRPADVLAAMRAGASGYLSKHASPDAYVAAIRAVAGGEFYLSAQLADLIQSAHKAQPAGREDPLSTREQQVLSYIARGFTHQQTATRMGVSKPTVDTYIARIRAKLGLGNKAELTIAALKYLERPPQ